MVHKFTIFFRLLKFSFFCCWWGHIIVLLEFIRRFLWIQNVDSEVMSILQYCGFYACCSWKKNTIILQCIQEAQNSLTLSFNVNNKKYYYKQMQFARQVEKGRYQPCTNSTRSVRIWPPSQGNIEVVIPDTWINLFPTS